MAVLTSILAEKTKSVYYTERTFINYFRERRNDSEHDEYENKYIYYSDSFIKAIEDLIDRAKAEPVYVKAISPVVSFDVNSKISEATHEMGVKNFTHLPITENWKLVGVLSEASIIQYMSKNPEICIDQNETFKENMELINYKYSDDNIQYASKDEDYDKVVYKFIEEYKNHQKVSCVFVTQNWKKWEWVLWILTARDIIWKE